MMQGKKHYSEKLFTSFQLSARVPESNFYRRLRDVLDLRWLYRKTKRYYGTEGQESIDPIVFFKMILVGYFENLGSDRRIIDTISLRMDLLYFIGYDIDEKLPWHSTLSRTRQLLGQEVFKALFRDILKQCIEKGMVAGCRQAIDSVQVKANASMNSLKRKEILKDAELYAVDLKGEEEQKANNDKGGNETHYSSTDPDARIATKPGKTTDLKYAAQVSVDTAHHVITEIQAHYADKHDAKCLSEMVTGVIDNLESEGLIVEQVLSDTNYSTGESLQYLNDHRLIGFIPNPAGYKAEREGFTYDKENNCYVCSQGIQLKYRRTYIENTGYTKKEYRSSAKDCKGCPLRKQCIGTSNQKRLTDSVDKPLYDVMHTKMQTQYGRRMMKLRQSTVEPVLGTLVNYLGMRRINTRGLKQAEKCMLMAAAAYNLKKLLKFQQKQIKVVAKVSEKCRNSIYTHFLYMWTLIFQLPATKTIMRQYAYP
jgi:transposase